MSLNTALDDIKAREAAATKGPWMKDPDEPVHIMKPDRPGFSWDGTVIATLQRDDFGLFEEANSDFIAHARTDIPKLLAALEAVEALLEGKYKLYAAICGETCVKGIHGVDHEAIADNIATNIRAAIEEALS